MKKLGEIFRFRENTFEPLPPAPGVLTEMHHKLKEDGVPVTGLSEDQYRKLVKAILKAKTYRDKLLLLFNATGEMLICTKVIFSEKDSIDLTPQEGSVNVQVYNDLVLEILRNADSEEKSHQHYKNRFTVFAEYEAKLNRRLKREQADPPIIIQTEIEAISKEYPARPKWIEASYLDFDDLPDHFNYSVDRGDVYSFLKGGGVIDYGFKFIDTRHHIMILQCQEVRKYEIYLLEQPKILAASNAATKLIVERLPEEEGRVYPQRNVLDSSAKNNNNVFNKHMPLEFAIEHFKAFVRNFSKNGKPFLTEDQLYNFIKRGFCGGAHVPKQKFNLSSRENSIVTYRFHQFYLKASSQFESTNQCQEKYIRLLTDNFDNWDYKAVKDNFAKKPGGFIKAD